MEYLFHYIPYKLKVINTYPQQEEFFFDLKILDVLGQKNLVKNFSFFGIN